MTVFDPSAVRQLETDTQSRDFVRTLIDTYQRMLDARVERILAALHASDAEQGLDAALSLRVSSIMTGAVEVAGIATHVADSLRSDDVAAARPHAVLLPAAAARARAALDTYMDEGASLAQGSSDSIR